MDKELVKLYVDTYRGDIEQYIPDLAECGEYQDMESMHDPIEDFTSDYIYDHEQTRARHPEICEAAKQIAVYYCGQRD